MNLIFELGTDKNFEEAVTALKESLKPYGFGVLWEMNFRDKFQEKDLDFYVNFKVLEVCNPLKAHEVLTTDIGAGYFLPCKMVVYEDENMVYIGMLQPTGLMTIYDNKALDNIADEVEKDLIAAISAAV